MEDTYKHKGERKKLVEEIKRKGFDDPHVLEVIGRVPRHFFMETGLEHLAYKDQAFPIGANQTISQPYTVAFQTWLLNVRKGDKILEIGTGSGYQTVILMELGASVFTIERQRELFLKTQVLLPKIGYNPHFFYGDGYLGQPSYGPFDKVLITAGAPSIPEELLKQLKPGGLLVAPIGDSHCQAMTTVTKINESEFETKKHGEFIFVPMLKGRAE